MKIRQFSSFFFLIFCLVSTNSTAQTENAIIGLWYNTEKTARIEILKNGSEFIGKIIWLNIPNPEGKPLKDEQNSDPQLRNRPLMGLAILDGLKYVGGIWKGGEIYDPKSGKTYSCELKLRSEKVLEVKGYVGFSFIGKTVEWTRIK